MSNTVAKETAESYDYTMKSLPKIYKRTLETNIPIKMTGNRDSLNSGTYHSIFKNPNLALDNTSKNENKDKYKELKKFMGEHHKTALIGKNYRDIYNMSSNDRPQNNPLISQNYSSAN